MSPRWGCGGVRVQRINSIHRRKCQRSGDRFSEYVLAVLTGRRDRLIDYRSPSLIECVVAYLLLVLSQVEAVLVSVQSMLSDPNFDSPANIDASVCVDG